MFAAALGLPRQEGVEDPLAARQVLLRRLHIGPAIHRAAGHAFEHHDLAGPRGGQRREHEVLAHAGIRLKHTAEYGWARLHRPSRRSAPARAGADRRASAPGRARTIARSRPCRWQRPRARALRRRLPVRIEPHVLQQRAGRRAARTPAIQAGILSRWSTDCAGPSSLALHSMALLPSGLRTAMPMPSTVGHSPAHPSSASSRSVCSAVSNMHWLGHDRAFEDLLRRAVRVDRHLVPRALQAERELHAGLSGADDGHASLHALGLQAQATAAQVSM